MSSDRFHHRRDDCRLCGSQDVEIAVPLRPIPIRTPNVGFQAKADDADAFEQEFAALDLYRCGGCGHLQLLDVVDPTVQYRDFRYRTSISLGLPEHFAAMASHLQHELDFDDEAKVFEIGSNDGTLLRAFRELGHSVLGIDPAQEIASEATRTGIPTLAEFFTSISAQSIRDKHGTFQLIVANNTLANLDDLGDVADGVRTLLADDGVFVVETSYGADVVANNLLDTIYHEHLSYFLVEPMETWFRRHGLELFRVERISTKGGSLRLFAQHAGGSRARDRSVDDTIAAEHAAGLHDPATYARFAGDLERACSELGDLVRAHREAGGRIAAYGASVGTITLLHQFRLTSELDFIVDDDPLAASLVGPNYDIPIVDADHLETDFPSLVVVLAHRYADVITAKNEAYLDAGGTFAVALPEVRTLAA